MSFYFLASSAVADDEGDRSAAGHRGNAHPNAVATVEDHPAVDEGDQTDEPVGPDIGGRPASKNASPSSSGSASTAGCVSYPEWALTAFPPS